MRAVFIDIDNTLLDFEEYVRQTMKTGFEHFGLKPYEPYMYNVFTEENNKLWHMIEAGTITFPELEKVRWNNIFRALGIEYDGTAFEKYFRSSLNESAIPVAGAYELLEYLHGKYILCADIPYLWRGHMSCWNICTESTYFVRQATVPMTSSFTDWSWQA